MTKIKQFWNGKLSLAESFWIWMVLANLAFKFVMVLFGSLFYPFLSYLIVMSQISWGIFSVIGAWRSATNYMKKNKKAYCGLTAKVVILGYAGEALVFVYILLVPVLY